MFAEWRLDLTRMTDVRKIHTYMTQAKQTQSGSDFCSLLLSTSQSGWPTCHNTHFFFPKMSGLVVSEFLCQVSEHRENLSKRTDFYSVLQSEQVIVL